MALHGKIEVNGYLIGGWSARRREAVIALGQPNTYACEAWRGLGDGEFGDRARFVIEHNYADGAFSLASKVLAEAHARLGATVPTWQGADRG